MVETAWDLESRKISRHTETQPRRGQLDDILFREGSVYGEIYLGGFGRRSLELKFHLAEVGLRVFQEGTEDRKYRVHFGEQYIWFDCNFVYMSGNDAQVAC